MRRRYRDVMRDLVTAVVDGTYAEGAWLPNERELATRFGCGRGVAREALRGLEERGLVDVRHARGARVRQRDDWDLRDPDVLCACIARGPDPDTIVHAIDARGAVESAAAARAIRHATDADLRLLAGRIADMHQAIAHPGSRRSGAGDPFVIADAWFHRTLVLLSDNPVLARLVDPLHPVLAELRHQHAQHREGAVVRHHQRILEGLSAREPELAADAIGAYARALAGWLRRTHVRRR
jgi:GntR family transcriptional repressor for pyruvate dehydrogenase complex